MLRRRRFIVQGQVQGVGFRPFVFSLAEECGLTGFVRNSPRGVVIEAQGGAQAIETFAGGLESRLPPLARITGLAYEDCPPVAGEKRFSIAPSTGGDSHAVLVSPDIATCPDCLADIRDPDNRRHAYAFTNCTNCGPRYSITRSIPYDRDATSMACFAMCPDCLAEYRNPRDRRFHAQPNACPVCGPQVLLLKAGEFAAADRGPDLWKTPDPEAADNEKQGAGEKKPAGGGVPRGPAALEELARELLRGKIAAVKGLGGFHLACDARDEAATALLRQRKHRPHKPFAVMAPDIEEAGRFALVEQEEAALLASREKPIVICGMRPGVLAGGISPDTAAVGIMLPYTPLHSLLFEYLRQNAADDRPLALVMTSGNPGGEPICLGNREALAKLAGMADVFLLHNRDILIRVDDSVLRVAPGGGTLHYRRARGYVPRPVTLASSGPCVLGVGPELKNTLCFTKGRDAFVSQHIGDMGNLETAAFHAEIREHMAALLKVSPRLAVRDLHPDYLSSRMAEDLAKERGIPVLPLQHHFAHAHAVLAEHAFSGRAIVLALDGTGLGEDGTLWGGEVLYVDCGPQTLQEKGQPLHERLASFAPMLLPGGEAAIREPWRIAHALMLRLGLGADRIHAGLVYADPMHVGLGDFPEAREREAVPGPGSLPWLPQHANTARLLPSVLEKRINCPVSTSCGRLFDAVSALLGLCNTTTYEGQAAIRLEEAQRWSHEEWRELAGAHGSSMLSAHAAYPCPVAVVSDGGRELTRLDTHALFAAVYEDLAKESPVSLVARRFHASLAAALVRLCSTLARERGIAHVGLSGGSMQNMTLALLLGKGLERAGLIPLRHKEIPPGDACVSLGQAAWGRYVLQGGGGHFKSEIPGCK